MPDVVTIYNESETMGHTKFVVQTLPRCGAGVVMNALSQHPQCLVAGPVFSGYTIADVADMRSSGSWRAHFDRYTTTAASRMHPDSPEMTAAGFISYRMPAAQQPGTGVKWEWSQTLWQYLTDRGHEEAKVIHIVREDPIARAISAVCELKTGVQAARKMSTAIREYTLSRKAYVVQPWLFRHFLEEWEVTENLTQGKAETLTITYESLMRSWANGIQLIQQFLSLPAVALTTQLAKLGDIPPHTQIANWTGLTESFRSTRWEQHFEKYTNKFLPEYQKQAAAVVETE